MKKWLAIPLFILLSSILIVPMASAQSVHFNLLWQNQFDYDGYSVHTTSTGDLLIISYSVIEKSGKKVFDYFVLDAATGSVKQEIHSISGYSYVFQTAKEHLYLVTYEEESNTVFLYDEQLNLVWSQDNTFGDFSKVAHHEAKEDTLLFYTAKNPAIPYFGFDLTGKKVPIPTIAYAVPSVEQCPGEFYCPPSDTVEVLIKDSIRKIEKTVVVQPSIPEGHHITQTLPFIYNIEKYYQDGAHDKIDWKQPDRYFLFFNTENEQYESANFIVEFDLQGRILRTLELPAVQGNFDYATNGCIFGFVYDNHYVRYQLHNFSIDSQSSLEGALNYLAIDQDAMKLVTDGALYLLDEKFQISKKIERPGAHYNGLKKLSQYLIVRSMNTEEASLVYDSDTLEKIATIPSADDYIETNRGKDIITYTANAFDYSYQLRYYNYALLDTYSPSKKWSITFNKAIKPASVNADTIYVMNDRGEKVNVTLLVEGKKVKVLPAGGYISGHIYTLHIEPGIVGHTGAPLSKRMTKIFLIQ